MKLRPYQQAASDAVIEHVKQSLAPCLIEAATGAGKSLLVSDIARRIHDMTGKRILALAPSAELVTQNAQKYADAGLKASIYSASAGQKSLRYPVVFGSPLTVKNRIGAFRDGYAMVILDEAHGITPTVRGIIDEMRDGNPYLRVVGMTATPYRLNDGYIFREWDDGKVNGEAFANDPYFAKMVYRITAPSLIEQGYLTPPVIGETGAEGYDTSGLTLNSRGQFDAADVDRAYHGHGRKTAAIVADVIARSKDRRGVMLFAATVQHAKEIMASLPPELSALVTGETPKAERDRIIRDFKAQRIKYIVNVAVLLVGFDAPHVDVLAILRRTESVGLLQQLIGRGLRLFDGKADCLARGTKVLTDKGEVKIEDITLEHKLWDGVSFVSHGGAICKGLQKVIYHDGICGTPDHKVMTNEGWETLAEAKHRGRRIVRTGLGGNPIRHEPDNLKECGGAIQQIEGGGGVHVLRTRLHEQPEQHEEATKYEGMPFLQREKARECSKVAIQEMPSTKSQMHEPESKGVLSLRRKGDTIQIRGREPSRTLDCGELGYCGQINGVGQNRQQRSLRAGEYSLGAQSCEYEQYEKNERKQGKVHKIQEGIPACEICGPNLDETYKHNDGSRNTREMGEAFIQTEREVWDILNSGPLQRFTANGRLVHNCLILDYTENIDTHCPDGDLFAPVVRAKTVKDSEAEPIEVHCPDCGSINMFTRHPDAEGFTLDKNGYCLDLDGERIETDFGPMPGHWGRRCGHVDNRGVRCEYRWTSKPCPQCDAPNDIAARYCCECKAEIVDPNEKLVADFRAMKKDPTQIQTDEVISVDFHDTLSARGNRTIRAEWNTPYRRFTTWHNPEPKFPRQERDWMLFNEATNGGKDAPETISYKKDADSGFYRVISYNREPDVEPEKPAIPGLRRPAMAG